MLSQQEISDRFEIQDLVFHYADLVDQKKIQELTTMKAYVNLLMSMNTDKTSAMVAFNLVKQSNKNPKDAWDKLNKKYSKSISKMIILIKLCFKCNLDQNCSFLDNKISLM